MTPAKPPMAGSPVIPKDDFARAAVGQLALLFVGATLFITLVLLTVSYFASPPSANAVDASTGTITLAVGAEPPQLDSTKSTDAQSFFILGHVMEGLVRYDKQGKIAPGVAQRWQLDAQKAMFYLRKDAVWSNGTPVTAHDFVYAWQTVVNPKTASQYAFILYSLKNAAAINQGELPPSALGVKAIDDHTLEVTLERPTPHFIKLAAFATYYPLNQTFHEQVGDSYGADADKLLYNGAFTLSRWIHSAHLTLEKNKQYWNAGIVRLNKIDMPYFTADGNTVVNLFRDDKVARAGIPDERLEDALRRHWPLTSFSDGAVFYLDFNHRPDRATHNWHLRRAMQLAFDPGEIVFKVLKGPANKPTNTLFPSWLGGVNERFASEYPPPTHSVDLPRARQHLQTAMQELGLETPPTLTLLTGDFNSASTKKLAEYFQNLYRERLGIEIRLDPQIFKQRLAKMSSGDFDIVASGWGPDYNDPLTFADLYSSWNENNRGRFNNPEVDRLVRVAESALDQRVRMQAFGEIQQLLYDNVALLPYLERGSVSVTHPRLQGVVRRTVGSDPDYTYAWIAPENASTPESTTLSPGAAQ